MVVRRCRAYYPHLDIWRQILTWYILLCYSAVMAILCCGKVYFIQDIRCGHGRQDDELFYVTFSLVYRDWYASVKYMSSTEVRGCVYRH